MKGGGYRNWLLAVLLIVFAFNQVDRLAFGLLLQEIKVDLALSDTQLGLLSGIAFALFYSVMGIPIARWADRGNRVTIIWLSTALWSAAVALCALAGNFLQLLLIRIGAAVGEAGCLPPAHSLIADHFTRAERPRAVARYMLGGPLSGVIGYFLAGWLNELYGWRATFLILGLIGIALAAGVRIILKEPRRDKSLTDVAGASTAAASAPQEAAALASAQPTLKEVCATLWANTTFRHLLLCFAVVSFFGNGIVKWQPAFFIRSHGLQTGELGTWLAVVYGLGGILGTFLGGELAARHAASNERLQLRAIAIVYGIGAVIWALTYLAPGHQLALGLLGLKILLVTMANGPLFATIQTLVPERMRAIAIAAIYLFANLIGMGLGPLAAGMLSDAFRPWAGDESLRYALLALCPGYLWGAWHVWHASRSVMRDVPSASVGLMTVQEKVG